MSSAIEFIEKSRLEEIHIQELYDHIQSNSELSSKQLSLHKQVLGQIEPNWKHDLRNLLGNAKRNSILINPRKNYWGLPRKPIGVNFDCDYCFDEMLKRASKACKQNEQFECKRSGQVLSISTYSDANICIENSSSKSKSLPKSMVCSKINHLLNCGGRLPIGNLHRWGNIESAIVFLCNQIEYYESEILFLNSK